MKSYIKTKKVIEVTISQRSRFPHIVIDNFLDSKEFKLLKTEAHSLNSGNFKTPENEHVAKKICSIDWKIWP